MAHHNEPGGLSSLEAAKRLTQWGPNELVKKARVSLLSKFIEQFKSFIIVILLIAAAISVVIGDAKDAAVILVILVMNAVLGVFQEYRAEKAIEAIRGMVAQKALVMRDGEKKEILASELVPGDLILLDAGARVPADASLVLASSLKVDESALTGESVPVKKEVAEVPEGAPLAERKNEVFMGTSVVYGSGHAVVSRTGMRTEFGRITDMIQATEKGDTPLKLKMDELGGQLGMIALAIVFLIFVEGLITGKGIFEMFITAVSLAVAAVPEGLPAVITITLAIGVRKMAARNAIVRKLASVETLGSTTVICSDKTGTLTKNEMTVRKIHADGNSIDVTGSGYSPSGHFILKGREISPPELALRIGALCNNAFLSKDDHSGWKMVGDPTEGALMVAAVKGGLEQKGLDEGYQRRAELPFDSDRKRMSTINSTPDGKLIACVKGAPESVLGLCNKINVKGKIVRLERKSRDRILAANRSMAASALRVLAIAYRENVPDREKYEIAEVESNLVFVALVGMIDPPRENVRHSIATCRRAGIRVVMITGDQKLTAFGVGSELGLVESEKQVITGAELDGLDDAALDRKMEGVSVVARASPEHKVRILEALKREGHVVAMTGDGVNDAPALKRSDVGVSMGVVGTDVARETSDIVLADDNFSTIVAAVEEGRAIYDNIRKFLRYVLTTNFAELLTVFGTMLLGMPLPLLPIHILWMNLVSDGLPAIALGTEDAEEDVMERSPRRRDEHVLHGMYSYFAIVALMMAAIAIFVYWVELTMTGDEAKARTVAFTTLVMMQLFHVFTCRSDTKTLGELGIRTNTNLLLASGAAVLLQIAIVQVPQLRFVFDTVQIGMSGWILAFAASIFIFLVVDRHKKEALPIRAQTGRWGTVRKAA